MVLFILGDLEGLAKRISVDYIVSGKKEEDGVGILKGVIYYL